MQERSDPSTTDRSADILHSTSHSTSIAVAYQIFTQSVDDHPFPRSAKSSRIELGPLAAAVSRSLSNSSSELTKKKKTIATTREDRCGAYGGEQRRDEHNWKDRGYNICGGGSGRLPLRPPSTPSSQSINHHKRSTNAAT